MLQPFLSFTHDTTFSVWHLRVLEVPGGFSVTVTRCCMYIVCDVTLLLLMLVLSVPSFIRLQQSRKRDGRNYMGQFQQAVICALRMFLSPNTIWACCFTQSQCWLQFMSIKDYTLCLLFFTFSSQASSLPLLLSWNIAVFINLNTLLCFFGITRFTNYLLCAFMSCWGLVSIAQTTVWPQESQLQETMAQTVKF